MWPFGKKAKQPEAKIEEEKLKQSIAAQLVFDPVTKQLKIKPKEPESPTKEPEPPPVVKLECPTCKQTLERHSKNRFKCPHCRNWIYFLGDQAVTREDHERLREKYYQARHEERLGQSMVEKIGELGFTDEMFHRREQELLRRTGVPPKQSAVILSLFNETILKLKDLDEMEERYHSLAIVLNGAGEESFHILQGAAKTKLAALKKKGFKNVHIFTCRMCEWCVQVDGKVLPIEEALKTMPIPIKECKNYPYNENHSFCICYYEPEYDDEYMMNSK